MLHSLADHPPATDWIGDWGRCPSCDVISKHGEECDTCKTAAEWSLSVTPSPAPPDLLQKANLRPTGTQILEASEDAAAWEELDYCIARVPDGTSETIKLVGFAMSMRSTLRLRDGDSMDFALRDVAGGRDSLARELSGWGMDRDQVAYALRKLEEFGTISCNGQLSQWVDPNADWKKKSGAKKYTIHASYRQIGDLVASTVSKQVSRTSTATVGVNPSSRRVEGMLKWALDNAVVGNRNGIGAWLANRCTEGWLPEDEIEPVMRVYATEVNERTGAPRYTMREAMSTLDGYFRRKEWGGTTKMRAKAWVRHVQF